MPDIDAGTALLPEDCQSAVSRLLRGLDFHLPGQCVGFLIVGSIALGDYQPGRSDIDFVAVCNAILELDAIAAVHAELVAEQPSPGVDGIYVTAKELAQYPNGIGIYVQGARVFSQSGSERHAPSWMILKDHGLAVRGPGPDRYGIPVDRRDVVDFSRQNLKTYWTNWVDKRDPGTSGPLSDENVSWGVLGISRLHAAICGDGCVSKSAAGRIALTRFPAHAAILNEALLLRAHCPGVRSAYASPTLRHEETMRYMRQVIEDAALSRRPLAG
ncbi:hypothetical protein GCM10007989_29140 [Devosia pacifica]|uniref:Nucleotidyltransferase-like protein n=1 Tax=Devosia pacifica TaxID=1335967 RepID=A0A918VXE2_9HYPH|nr:hypothetical protein [Devosia pacifica]GHA31322.1 hypothetical protein GCM10007989_29140 [Devosia pacifica]